MPGVWRAETSKPDLRMLSSSMLEERKPSTWCKGYNVIDKNAQHQWCQHKCWRCSVTNGLHLLNLAAHIHSHFLSWPSHLCTIWFNLSWRQTFWKVSFTKLAGFFFFIYTLPQPDDSLMTPPWWCLSLIPLLQDFSFVAWVEQVDT